MQGRPHDYDDDQTLYRPPLNGANGVYAYVTAAAGIGCNNTIFGDPLVGTIKSCEYAPVGSSTTPSAPAIPVVTVTPIWIACGSENSTCSFSGTHKVRYGANGSYAYADATASIACNNATFGDPAYGINKGCSFAQ